MLKPSPIFNSVPTVGEIARRAGASITQVEYVVRTRRIEPTSRAGNARVFGEREVETIIAELARIASAKEAR